MTEKQFKVVDDYLVSYDGDYFDLHKPSDIRELVTVANYVVDENEQLKSDNNRLVNETAKIVAKHQGRVLDLIDDKIDELEEKYKFGQEVYHGCPMHNIRFGINTLKELKKELTE